MTSQTNPGETTTIDWQQGHWTHPPAQVHDEGSSLLVEAVEGSDAWRTTSYGFVHDDEHALLAPLATGLAVEVSFVAAFSQQFDQAGLFLRGGEECWVKAGVEYADGVPQLGAVVTNPHSDWSVAPVPEWDGREVTIRASREGDAITLRARVDDEPLRLVRVVPMPPEVELEAGPLVCAPTRAGLQVRFTGWRTGPADAALHPEPAAPAPSRPETDHPPIAELHPDTRRPARLGQTVLTGASWPRQGGAP